MDAEKLNGGSYQEKQALVLRVYHNLRSQSRFKSVPIVVIPETEPGGALSECGTFFSPLSPSERHNILVMRESGTGDARMFGAKKSQAVTIAMRNRTHWLLRENALAFDGDLLTISPMGPSRMQQEFITQLKAYKIVREGSLGKEKFTITGKSSGVNDDLLISFMTPVYWSTKFFERNDDVEYHAFRARIESQRYR